MEEQTQSPESHNKPEELPKEHHTSRLRQFFHNKWARVGLGAGGAALLVVLVWFAWPNTPFAKLGVDLADTEGQVQYRLSSDSEWETALEGQSLREGAHVRTLDESRAVLNIDDGSAVRLNSNSSVVLKKLTPKHILVENTGGDVYTRVVKDADRTFEIKSDNATYRSLGTAYRTFNTDDKDGVEVYHSKVNILGLQADGSVVVEQGERYYKVNKNAPDSEGKVTELSLEELSGDEFVTWNSEQDKKDFQKELGVLFDLKPPTLEVSAPANGFVTNADKVEVKGAVEAGSKVLVNGQETANNSGQFAFTLALNVGENGIKVEAQDGAGNKTVKNLTVTRQGAATSSSPKFTLVGTKVDKGVSFTWNISGITVTKGFKIVKGTSANPTYSSKSEHAYVENNATRSYTWKIQDGKTYHFRICTYDGSTCTNYSNNVTVTTPPKPVTDPPTGSLTLSHSGGSNVSWVLNGSAPYGFKLVWSTSAGPTYPGSSATFYEKTATSGSITSSPGNYYVRICMYHDGSCVNYSNELYFTVP